MDSNPAQLTKLFKVNGQPLVLSPSQQQIFDLIATQSHPRNQIIAPTQYGKSLTVALAVLCRALAMNEKFIVLAPNEKKAQIIMGYIIDHCFDSPIFTNQLELDETISLDRLRRERSRNHITFKGGGGVMTLSLDARNGKRNYEAAMGFGGNRIILDESSLIDDTLYASVKRMLGGYPYDDTFLLEIGNPFHRNHFYRTWHSEGYNKIFIDYQIGLAEGRYDPRHIEEARDEAYFDVYYECKFPGEDSIDEFGYRTLITNEEITQALVEKDEDIIKDNTLYLGADIAGGGDYNVFVMRTDKVAWIETMNRSNDTMTNVSEIQRIKEKYPSLESSHIFIDDIGIGRGVTDRLHEVDINAKGVIAGGEPKDKTKYLNAKAEGYWLAAKWIKEGGKLERNDKFRQMTWIKYKVTTDKAIQIEPKDELKRRHGKSPDFAEALMLSFVPPDPVPSIRIISMGPADGWHRWE